MTAKEKRLQAIAFHESNTKDCGGRGRAFELMCAFDGSHKTKVAEQNEVDVKVKIIRDNGRIWYAPTECKTNGGRVDELLVEKPKAKFVIYRLEYTQKLKNSVDVRTVPPVIIPTNLFVTALKKINAIKVINKKGVFDGYGIQVSSKKLYEKLLDYIDNYGDAILFDNQKTYEEWDFEGLEF